MRTSWNSRGAGALAILCLAAVACSTGSRASGGPIRIGAVYPLSGPDRQGGVDELRGVRLAARLANASGGVRGQPVVIEPVNASGSDAVPSAFALLAGRGIRIVFGANGSEVSSAAQAEASRRGMLYWETGAVGETEGRMAGDAGAGPLVFRVAPSGLVLGSSGISFVVDRVATRLHRSPRSLRIAVVNVDDLYGRTVARGALREIARRHLRLVGRFRYGLVRPDFGSLIARVKAARPNVLFASSYVPDGVALNREAVRQHLHLVANIGTSSSYCMPAFGRALGALAVGTFATDKPDAEALNRSGLTPAGRALLDRAEAAYRGTYHSTMDAPALAGFSAAWALLRDVLPHVSSLAPADVARAALAADLPMGSLPNGSGLRFSGPGSGAPGSNLRALSVIWEWVGVDRRMVVWPPRYATGPIRVLPLAA